MTPPPPRRRLSCVICEWLEEQSNAQQADFSAPIEPKEGSARFSLPDPGGRPDSINAVQGDSPYETFPKTAFKPVFRILK